MLSEDWKNEVSKTEQLQIAEGELTMEEDLNLREMVRNV